MDFNCTRIISRLIASIDFRFVIWFDKYGRIYGIKEVTKDGAKIEYVNTEYAI